MKELKPPREILSTDENGKLLYKPLTDGELTQMYSELSREELIEALINTEKLVNALKYITRTSTTLEEVVVKSYAIENKLKIK